MSSSDMGRVQPSAASTAWEIDPGVERIELDDTGKAEVMFTVRNPGPVDDRATVDIVGSEQTDGKWFTVAEPQQTVPHGGSKAFVAVVKPGEKAPSGTHWLAGRVYSAHVAPEENSVISDRVTFEIPEPKKPPKPKWWLWALIGGALVLIVVGVVLFLVLGGGPEVPDVVGKTQADATRLITDEGLTPKPEVVGSATVQKGKVISQSPPPGSSAEEGSPVTIVVSSGPNFVTVPSVDGQNPVQAAQTLQNAGLRVIITSRRSLKVPEGDVIGTKPAAGESVAEGSDVELLISSGFILRPTNELPICEINPKFCDKVKLPGGFGE